jgi:hypothetical protein
MSEICYFYNHPQIVLSTSKIVAGLLIGALILWWGTNSSVLLIGYSPGVNGWNGGCCPHLNWLMKPVSLLKALQLKWLLKRRNRTYLMSGYEPPPDLTCRQLLNCVGFDNTRRFISTNYRFLLTHNYHFFLRFVRFSAFHQSDTLFSTN